MAVSHSKPDEVRRILIVDDTQAIHDDFRKILEAAEGEPDEMAAAEAVLFEEEERKSQRLNFKLDSAFQGKQALEMVQRALQENRPYEMAFVDVRMPPGWDGVETIAKIWEVDPDLQVVICTAYADYSWSEMTEKLGFPDRLVILKKPFDPVEVMQLAHAMTEKWRLLQETRRKMDELEGLVSERTRHLQEANAKLQVEVAQRKRHEECLALQGGVTHVLANSTATSDETTNQILQIICRSMSWEIGLLWMVDQHSKVLRCYAIWHPPSTEFSDFEAACQQLVFNRGTDLPGRVWESGQPLWIPDIMTVSSFIRLPVAAKAGLRAAFAFPLRFHGEILGVLEFYGDQIRQPEDDMLHMFVTLSSQIGQSIDRKKLEEQLRQSQKMEAIGHLAGGIAHDFNNVLTVIQGYAQVLKMKSNQDADTLEGLNQIVLAGERAANLTRQLLTFSRKQLMQPAALDLNKSIANLSPMLHRTLGEDVALQFNYSSEPAIIHADENMIGQVLINLTVNARDAMPTGGRLIIRTEPVSVDESNVNHHPEGWPGEFVCLTVSDNGCGIPPENLPRIFEPFFSTKGVGKGTGLGLSTVYGIVQQHHGWIEVASQVGVGTVFRVFFPRMKDSSVQLDEEDVYADIKGGTETILLAEDESPVRSIARSVLQRAGYCVLEASSGVEALSVWDQCEGKVDLLLTDMVMPDGINGCELAQRLQARKPGLKIIYTSGYSPVGILDKDGSLEDNIFLPKPYHPQKLLEIIRQTLDQQPVISKPAESKS